MRVKIAGKKWLIQDAIIWGLCWKGQQVIDIDPRSRPKTRLRVLIHELLHAMHPKWSEKQVDAESRVLAEALRKDGWRRKHREN